jgi:hypothetical protein
MIVPSRKWVECCEDHAGVCDQIWRVRGKTAETPVGTTLSHVYRLQNVLLLSLKDTMIRSNFGQRHSSYLAGLAEWSHSMFRIRAISINAR